MYDPTIGRFLSEDPIGMLDDVNPYRYVGNNPLTNTDPSGLCKDEVAVEYCVSPDDASPAEDIPPWKKDIPWKPEKPGEDDDYWMPGYEIKEGDFLYRLDPNDKDLTPPRARAPGPKLPPPLEGTYKLFEGWWWDEGEMLEKNPFDDPTDPGIRKPPPWPKWATPDAEARVILNASGKWLEIRSSNPPRRELYWYNPDTKEWEPRDPNDPKQPDWTNKENIQ